MNSQRLAVALSLLNLILLVWNAAHIGRASVGDGAILRGRGLQIVDDSGAVRASINVYPGNSAAISAVRVPGSTGVTVIDFNYDGYSDLVVRRGWPTVTLEPHEGGPGGLSYGMSSLPQPSDFWAVGDFDGDGYWDTIEPNCPDCRPPTMWVRYGVPEGWGAPRPRTTAMDASLPGLQTAVVDLNADGYDDLLVAGPGDGATSWYAGSPAGLADVPTRIVRR